MTEVFCIMTLSTAQPQQQSHTSGKSLFNKGKEISSSSAKIMRVDVEYLYNLLKM